MNYQNLHQHLLDGRWPQLYASLSALSNTDFRLAASYLRTVVLPTLPNNAFWTALFQLVRYRRQAFLSCVLAAEHLASSDQLDFDCDGVRCFAAYLLDQHPASIPKVLNMLLPTLRSHRQIDALFSAFHVDDCRQQIKALLRVESPLVYYQMFLTLCHQPDSRQLALDCSRQVMRRGGDMAFNMTAILQAYFGLHELRGQFSLLIQPYELSLLDRSEQAFYHLLNGKRPQL